MSTGLSVKAQWSVAGASSQATDPTGDLGASNKTFPFDADYMSASGHVIGTGTPTGTPKVFASNDHDRNREAIDRWNGTWEDVSSLLNPVMAAPAGAGFSYLIELSGLRFRSFYFDYARSSGTGEVRAVWGKQIV